MQHIAELLLLCLTFGSCKSGCIMCSGLTIQSSATPTGERLRKLDNRCITQTVHKLKGQSALAPARC